MSAQNFEIDAHSIDRCLGVNDHTPMACVGRQAEVCFAASNGGPNMVQAACQWSEHEFWDGALNQVYEDLLEFTARKEADDDHYEQNQLTDPLRKMQRTWIAFRDATCGFALAGAKPFGSASGPVESRCMMRETARQYFQLQNIAGGYR